MKSASNIGRSLHVLLLALCGLSFYALVLMLLVLIVGLAVSTNAHAQAGSANATPAGRLHTAMSSGPCG